MKHCFTLLCLFVMMTNTLLASDKLKDIERQLTELGKQLQSDSTDELRANSNQKFHQLLAAALILPESFDFPFSEVENLSTLRSEDNIIKLYTWTLPACNGEKYSFFGFLQVFDLEKKQTETIELAAREYANNRSAEDMILDPGNWYGCVYYKIIQKKHKKSTNYTLLGWQGRNMKTTRKIIDVLSLGIQGPKFGAPVFKIYEEYKSRLVFEFNIRAVMSLNYNEASGAIMMDHLSPSDPRLENVYEYYGPDFTYDALYFKRGSWILKEHVELKNNQVKSDTPAPELIKDKRVFQRKRKEDQ